MRNYLVFFIFMLGLFSTKAIANYTCVGPVKGLSINPKDGRLYVETLTGITWPVLCSIETINNGISPETCKQIYSILLSAQIAKKDVTLWFSDDSTGGSCSSHPGWAALTGWYFGPKIN